MASRPNAASPAEEVFPLEGKCIDEQKNFSQFSLPAAGHPRGVWLPA